MAERSGKAKIRYGSLEIREDMRFQEKTWTVERVGWAVMALLVLAALLGLFARGPLSTAVARADAATVSYDRFVRYGAASSIRIEIHSVPAGADAVAVRIGPDYLKAVEIERIHPQPEGAFAGPDGLTLRFAAPPEGAAVIRLSVKPNTIGAANAEIAVGGGEPVRFVQFVYP